MGTNSSKNTFSSSKRGTGSTNPARGVQGKIPLGTSSTHPTSKTGKQSYGKG